MPGSCPDSQRVRPNAAVRRDLRLPRHERVANPDSRRPREPRKVAVVSLES